MELNCDSKSRYITEWMSHREFLEITLILWQVSTFGSLEIMQVGCILNYQIMISLEKTRKKLDLGNSWTRASSAKLEKAASYKNVYVYQIIFDLLIMTFFSLDHDFRYTNSNCQKMMWFFFAINLFLGQIFGDDL